MKKTDYTHILLYGITVILFYLLNNVIPIVRDDIMYQFMCKPTGYYFDYTNPIDSLSEVFASQYNHYISWGGRAIVHGFTQFFCGISGKWLFDIFAALMFALWIPAFGRLSFPQARRLHVIPLGLLTTLIIWIASGEPTMFYDGIAFSMNYLYSSLLCMLFMLCVTSAREWNTYQGILIFVLSFFTGWSQEIFVVGTGAYIMTWALPRFKQLRRQQIVSIALFCIGACLLIFSPGNFTRAKQDGSSEHFGLFVHCLENYSLVITIAVILWQYLRNRLQLVNFIRNEYPVISAWVMSVLFISVTSGSSFISGRLVIGVCFWGVILIMRYVSTTGIPNCLNKLSSVACIMFPLLLIGIIHYQRAAGKEFERLYGECSSEENKEVYFCFRELGTPDILRKYIIYRYEKGHNEAWDHYYPEIYGKAVHVVDESTLHCFSPENKVSGNNPFYEAKDYLYTKSPLASSVKLTITEGNYNKYDCMTMLKRCYFLIKKDKPKVRTNTYSVTPLYIDHNDTIYQVDVSLSAKVRDVTDIRIAAEEK